METASVAGRDEWNALVLGGPGGEMRPLAQWQPS